MCLHYLWIHKCIHWTITTTFYFLEMRTVLNLFWLTLTLTHPFEKWKVHTALQKVISVLGVFGLDHKSTRRGKKRKRHQSNWGLGCIRPFHLFPKSLWWQRHATQSTQGMSHPISLGSVSTVLLLLFYNKVTVWISSHLLFEHFFIPLKFQRILSSFLSVTFFHMSTRIRINPWPLIASWSCGASFAPLLPPGPHKSWPCNGLNLYIGALLLSHKSWII
jgi:hypothetical protein